MNPYFEVVELTKPTPPLSAEDAAMFDAADAEMRRRYAEAEAAGWPEPSADEMEFIDRMTGI